MHIYVCIFNYRLAGSSLEENKNELCLRRSRKISDTGPYRDAEEFNSETGCEKTVSPRLVHTHIHTHTGSYIYYI